MSQEQNVPPQKGKPEGNEQPRPTPPPAQGSGPARDEDQIRQTLSEAARKGAAEVDFDDLPEPLPDLDEGPPPGPVDDIQVRLSQASRHGTRTEVEFEELPEPLPDLDEGPPPGPVDEIQDVLFDAAQHGAPAEVDFDRLPEPGRAPTKKVVRFKPKTQPVPAAPVQAVEHVPAPAPALVTGEFWLLLVLFVSFRVLTLFLLRPGGFLRDWSDFDTYLGIAGLADYSLYPFFDFWLEWPPVVPWLAVGVYKLSLLLPPWPDDPRFWFILLLGSVFVLFEAGNFVLIYRLARRLFQDAVTVNRVLWLYAGLFPPVYAMLGFFDGTALFFMLLALELLLSERCIPSAVAVGLGVMVKIIPILMLPVALRRIWHRHQDNRREVGIELGIYAVVFGLTVVLLLAPFVIRGPEWLLASARSIIGRSSWETVWAVAEGYYGFGEVAGDRLNPAETNFAVHQGGLPWWLITLGFAGVYAYIFSRKADYSRASPVIAFAGLTVAVFLLYTKGYSPQFLVYLLPFIVLLFPDVRGLVYALTLTGLNILEQPVYFVLLPDAAWLLAFVVIARFLLLVILALEFSLLIWPTEARLAWLADLQPRLPLAIGGLGLAALLVLVPLLLSTYYENGLRGSPLGAFVGFMEIQSDPDLPEPRLLVNDQATYRRIYPYLRSDFDIHLVGGFDQYAGAPRITDYLQDQETVWILPAGAQEQRLANVMGENGRQLATFDFEDLGTASLYSLNDNLSPYIPPARFSAGIELLTYEVEVKRGAVEVDLFWRTRDPLRQSFIVFTHLLDAEGEWVAGHDSIPTDGAALTSDWPVGAVQADRHRIPIPADLPPGDYVVVAGLYLQSDPGARLAGIDPDGNPLPNQVVPLDAVRLP